jgi:uncharacterized protein YjbI with pentapeptide repeats
MMLHSKSIGLKITEARKRINISQAALAQQISISPQAVGKWERGESTPDVTTLNRLARIFGVDLNYFSNDFPSIDTEATIDHPIHHNTQEPASFKHRKNVDWNWDMSKGNWVDADFSGVKNLKEKFSSSNIKNCKFLDSNLSGLTLKGNYIDSCDFSASDMRNSKIHSSSLSKSCFIACSLIDTEFQKSDINNCNFKKANFSGAEFSGINFQKNAIEMAVWRHTSFKETSLLEITFDGMIEDCSFENCGFGKVKFQNATILNSFFKNNRKLKRVEFENCKVDKLTYAFLKNNQANLEGVTVLA